METANTKGALDGIKVVDLSRVLGGPICGQALADHGADVIKVEPPQGDETRAWGPPFVDGAASYYLGANRNKRGIAIDLSRNEGRDLVLRLLAEADVLVENFRPGTLEKWGMGYEQVLARRFPRLIHCRISGFGGDGPLGGYPGYDAVIQAMAGLMSINGTPDSGAVRMGPWKLIERYEDGRVHLYNLDADIGERNDLARTDPDRVAAMRARLHAWYGKVDAKFLRPIEGGPEPWRP